MCASKAVTLIWGPAVATTRASKGGGEQAAHLITNYAIKSVKPTGNSPHLKSAFSFTRLERLNGMQILLFLIFIAVPIIEIALFIQAGEIIGIVPTILITIGTAIAGSFLMRVQGFAALNRFAQAVEQGEMPVTPVIDGIGILSAGLLLLTPGLFTDMIGLLLFVPPIRRGLARRAFSRALKSGRVHIRTFGGAGGSGPPPGGPSPQGPQGANGGFTRSPHVVDAEFETIDPDEDDEDATRLDRDKGAGPKRRGSSPWRKR
jgi:UPF0716 protein FxsA